jgi:Skp family chaperone for outer membrane proteins
MKGLFMSIPAFLRKSLADRKSLLIGALALLAVALLLPMGRSVQAQGQAQSAPAGGTSVRIATANVGRIFNDIKERTEVKNKFDAEVSNLASIEKQKKQKVSDLQAARDLLKPNSPEWDEANRQLLNAAIEFRAWGELSQADLDRKRKQQTKGLYDKIIAAIGEVAQQRGIDIVIATQNTDLPENLDEISVKQLQATLLQRDVLYSAPKVDVSADVIAIMDARFSQSH